MDPTEVSVFEEARRLGVHRTVHAGEAGPPGAVAQVCMMLYTPEIESGIPICPRENLSYL